MVDMLLSDVISVARMLSQFGLLELGRHLHHVYLELDAASKALELFVVQQGDLEVLPARHGGEDARKEKGLVCVVSILESIENIHEQRLDVHPLESLEEQRRKLDEVCEFLRQVAFTIDQLEDFLPLAQVPHNYKGHHVQSQILQRLVNRLNSWINQIIVICTHFNDLRCENQSIAAITDLHGFVLFGLYLVLLVAQLLCPLYCFGVEVIEPAEQAVVREVADAQQLLVVAVSTLKLHLAKYAPE